MPDKRKHRGPHPADGNLFAQPQWPKLQQAVRDLSWLLSQGYAEKGAIKLVGDRYRLKERQRMAVIRASCSQQAALHRQTTQAHTYDLAGNALHIDGFNLLITIESALSDGFLLEGVDGCYRDLASIHGSYKRVMETEEAIILIGKILESLEVHQSVWYFDKPVSNSGRLKKMVLNTAQAFGWNWDSVLHYNPDKVLIEINQTIASSDSIVLDKAYQWFNFSRFIVDNFIKEATVLPLSRLVK
jgi:hypothetical protein